MLGNGWFPDSSGGTERYFRALFDELRTNGQESRAIVVAGEGSPEEGVTAAATPDERLLERLRRFYTAAGQDGAGADLVDVHFALYGLLPVTFGGLRRKPFVVHFHGPWADESAAAGESLVAVGVKRFVERLVYRRSTAAITLSMAFKRILVERYGVAPWCVEVIAPGVDLDRFSPGDRAAARARFGLDSEAWLACSIRRLVPRMGVDVLLQAWALRQGDGLLVVAGEGPERERLERLAVELGIGGSVRFVGRLDDDELVELYRAADVSVVSSTALEGFGLVVLESLACGTPAVVSAVGGLPEAVEGLEPTVVVAPRDPLALAQRLSGPLPDRDSCRAHAERYSWRRPVERHIDLYDRVVHGDPARKLRVVYLDHTAKLSGAEIALLRLLPALVGVEPHVILSENGPLVERLLTARISVEVLPLAARASRLSRKEVRLATGLSLNGVLTGVYAVRLARRLRQIRPDLVHTNSLKAAIYGGLAARLAGIPVVAHAHDRLTDDYLPAGAARIARAAFLLSDAVIAPSKAVAVTVGRPAHVVPWAADVVHKPGRASVHPFRVGIAGRIAPWKGQHVFIQAFAQAFPHGDEQAVVVGAPLFGVSEHRYLDELRVLGHSLGLDGRLRFTGFVDDVSAELVTLDALVHGSIIPEPFGQVVSEGMAAGLPVVASAAGGPAELISHGVDGLLYRPGDVDALATHLRALAHDASLRHRLGAAARRRARGYTPAAVAERVRTVYAEVLPDRVSDDVLPSSVWEIAS